MGSVGGERGNFDPAHHTCPPPRPRPQDLKTKLEAGVSAETQIHADLGRLKTLLGELQAGASAVFEKQQSHSLQVAALHYKATALDSGVPMTVDGDGNLQLKDAEAVSDSAALAQLQDMITRAEAALATQEAH